MSTSSPRLLVSSPDSDPALSPSDDGGHEQLGAALDRPSVRSLHRVARDSPTLSSSRGSVQGRVTEAAWQAAQKWREEVKDPWDPCILALDGGGIRGYSSALIIHRLMQEVYDLELELEREEPTGEDLPDCAAELLPCHYFDFMYGCSTGGLIAIMLSRLRMTVGECLAQYRLVGDRLFGRKNPIPFMTKYKSEPLEKAVAELVEARGLGDMHPWPAQADRADSLYDKTSAGGEFDVTKPRVCQSACLTAVHNYAVSEAYVLRSFDHSYGSELDFWLTPLNSGADALTIVQTCRASSAAPMFFSPLEATIDGELRIFKDGGIRSNNSADVAYNEFVSMYHPHALDPDQVLTPALLLSIGTGIDRESPDGFLSGALPWPLSHFGWVRRLAENLSVIPNLLVKYTESESKHLKMKDLAHGENKWYKRLNVSAGMDGMRLDHWVKGEYHGETIAGGASLKMMEDATLEYLQREAEPLDNFAAPKVKLRHAAEKLVRIRRARKRLGGPRWDVFEGHGLKESLTRQEQEADAREGA